MNSPPGNVVLDLDGVVYIGSSAVPGAAAAISAITDRGYRLLYATNSAIHTRSAVAERITSLTGAAVETEQVITSALAAVSILGPGDQPVYVIGEEGITAELEAAGIGITEDHAVAASVVIGLDRSVTYPRLRDAALAVRSGARLIATNTDATFPAAGGQWPGAGALVAALETATGVSAVVAGKPHDPMLRAVRRRLAPGPVWVVGDRPETDLGLAIAGGWIPVLVLSGVTSDPGQVPESMRPRHVLAGLGDLPDLLPQSP